MSEEQKSEKQIIEKLSHINDTPSAFWRQELNKANHQIERLRIRNRNLNLRVKEFEQVCETTLNFLSQSSKYDWDGELTTLIERVLKGKT